MYYNVLKSLGYRHRYSLGIKNKWFNQLILKNYFFQYNVYSLNRLRQHTISICKLRLRCIMNGRSRSVFSKYRLSRFFIKKFSQNGNLNGILKK